MDMVPFNRVLQIRIEAMDWGTCRMSIPFREEFIGDPIRRALHGGVISALVDTCGGAALWTQCDPEDRLSTVDLRVDYLRKGEPEMLFVDGHVLRLGNRVGVTEMVAYHAGRRHEPVASGKGVYNVRRKSES
ncbi:MAG: hotdog fold thioesterase [Deltaproteobacteria bacterium]|nr:hotdog fold thioesterase [Deltaproteobacteria bacterium]